MLTKIINILNLFFKNYTDDKYKKYDDNNIKGYIYFCNYFFYDILNKKHDLEEKKIDEEIDKENNEHKIKIENLKLKKANSKKNKANSKKWFKKKIEDIKKYFEIKKNYIKAPIKRDVWNEYIKEEYGKAKCWCCKSKDITQLDFEVGHIVSENMGGTNLKNNLLPICSKCNKSMRDQTMFHFMEDNNYGRFTDQQKYNYLKINNFNDPIIKLVIDNRL